MGKKLVASNETAATESTITLSAFISGIFKTMHYIESPAALWEQTNEESTNSNCLY